MISAVRPVSLSCDVPKVRPVSKVPVIKGRAEVERLANNTNQQATSFTKKLGRHLDILI